MLTPDQKGRILDHLRRLHAESVPCPFCRATSWSLGLADSTGYIARSCQRCGYTYLIDPGVLDLVAVWHTPMSGPVQRILLDRDDPRIDAPTTTDRPGSA